MTISTWGISASFPEYRASVTPFPRTRLPVCLTPFRAQVTRLLSRVRTGAERRSGEHPSRSAVMKPLRAPVIRTFMVISYLSTLLWCFVANEMLKSFTGRKCYIATFLSFSGSSRGSCGSPSCRRRTVRRCTTGSESNPGNCAFARLPAATRACRPAPLFRAFLSRA